MSDLSACDVVIIVFAMDGCHHCHEYMPRFERMLGSFQAKGWPFVYYDARPAFARGEMPVVIVDGASQDPTISQLADQHGVEGMPTTLILRRWGPVTKLEGAVSDRELYDALVATCHG